MDTYFSLFCILALSEASRAEYGDRIKNATVTWGDNLDMEESRHVGYVVPPPVPRAYTDLPITFKAPYIDAKDYWSDTRRTDYQPYPSQDVFSRPLDTFYGIMNQFFGGDNTQRRSPTIAPYRQQPYPFENPYYQQSKPYYLPGPKPLRASIQKLEPQRNPDYPHFVKILNDVLVENGQKYTSQQPVIEKPHYYYENLAPTTYKPRTRYRTSTVPPSSIQDQLPPVKHGQDTRIPYVIDTTSPRPTISSSGTRIVFPAQTEPVPPLDIAIDVRNAETAVTKKPRTSTTTTIAPTHQTTTSTPIVEITTDGESGIKTTTISTPQQINETQTIKTTTSIPLETVNQFTTLPPPLIDEQAKPTPFFTETEQNLQTEPSEVKTVVTEILLTTEPIESNRFASPFPKNLRKFGPQATSADYVTELTLKGLHDANATHASVPKFAANMSSVINYVLEHVNNTSNILPIDDELSLDAKILKDTNWDGFQSFNTTTEFITTTKRYETTTVLPTTTEVVYTTIATTLPPTTTESTPMDKQTVVATRVTQSVSRSDRTRQRSKLTVTTTGEPPTKENEVSDFPSTTQTNLISTQETDLTTTQPKIQTTTENNKAIENLDVEFVTETQTTTQQPQRAWKYPTTESNEVEVITVTPQQPRSARKYQRTTENNLSSEKSDVEFISEASTTTQQPRRARKYQRRPSVQNFTKSAKRTTENPLRLGTLSRPFYQRRTRPNVTLTFGNRASKRVDQSTEVTKLDAPKEEEIKARRNLYARKKYPSVLRRVTTELPEADLIQ